jgi:phosphoribosylformylglycinamidine synthase I
MRACVVLFPGLNADAEMVRTLSLVGASVTVIHHTETRLPDATDLVAIPGGFSYGDYLRCGAIAKVAPILSAIRAHADAGGFVLGVCNGFQILTECGLLPGALTRNTGLKFECRDIYVQVTHDGPFTPKAGAVWRLPIAHAEGRYQASRATLAELENKGLVALRYCDANGLRSANANASANANPNGSVDDIAGIYGGPRKNVLGLMPHPERMSEPALGGTDGKKLFDLCAASVTARASVNVTLRSASR